jgi:hypothetical protein
MSTTCLSRSCSGLVWPTTSAHNRATPLRCNSCTLQRSQRSGDAIRQPVAAAVGGMVLWLVGWAHSGSNTMANIKIAPPPTGCVAEPKGAQHTCLPNLPALPALPALPSPSRANAHGHTRLWAKMYWRRGSGTRSRHNRPELPWPFGIRLELRRVRTQCMPLRAEPPAAARANPRLQWSAVLIAEQTPYRPATAVPMLAALTYGRTVHRCCAALVAYIRPGRSLP